MLQSDSIEKICTRYFATVTKQSFTFNGKRFDPKPLKVSPLLLRDYTCPPSCSGCCFRFSLDYLPSEDKPDGVEKRKVEFNGKVFDIWTDWQEENKGLKCRHSRKEDGRCGIYAVRPFTCDFELIRSLQSADEDHPNILTQKLFGRGWSYTRVDGGKGALCEMLPQSEKSVQEVIRKLNRLKDWTDYFEIDTWLPDLLQIIKSKRLTSHITFHPENPKGFGL